VPTPPLLPEPLPADLARLDPLDRVTRPGFGALVEEARRRVEPGAAIAIVPASDAPGDQRDAWQAAWLLWPRRATIVQRGSEPLQKHGAWLLLEGAGSIRAFDRGQPR
jgi:hypothetical protein